MSKNSIPKGKFINALVQGDDLVILEIYERFFPKALVYILQNKGTHSQAKDIFQEALLCIVIGVKERNLKVDCFEAYLYTICKNMWKKELEKLKKRVIKEDVIALVDKETNFALFMIEQEQLDLYREKFGMLSENCKEILSLFFNEMSYDEIVKELAYATVNTARQRIFKCKKKLIEMIKSDSRFNQY
ncbi:RNA polymerase sigma factor [Aquimarina sp. AU474]|uniref:RNA polymerase sigma factor n=1 Tax=Aquimarina sp. AU474 TaxID=2108529 RepID=UPI000D695E3B|nr:sigma-70 family RNA polymerase sigma factor [Aquimarina sp. AU474]